MQNHCAQGPVTEFAATIPSWLNRDVIYGKIIHSSYVKDLLPNDIMNKPKTGFDFSIAKWFRSDLATLLKETLLGEKYACRGLFEQRMLKKMVNEHIEGGSDWSNRLWAFMFLELWFRDFID